MRTFTSEVSKVEVATVPGAEVEEEAEAEDEKDEEQEEDMEDEEHEEHEEAEEEQDIPHDLDGYDKKTLFA